MSTKARSEAAGNGITGLKVRQEGSESIVYFHRVTIRFVLVAYLHLTSVASARTLTFFLARRYYKNKYAFLSLMQNTFSRLYKKTAHDHDTALFFPKRSTGEVLN